MLRAIRTDVLIAMFIAGSVNIGMLLLAASTLLGLEVDSLASAYTAIGTQLGPAVAVVFAVALLASGLASTSVGGYAGAVIMDGLLHRRVPLLWRRLVTAVPALILLAVGLEPTRLLVISQVVLSFGIPFALVPLVRIAADRELMRLVPTRRAVLALAWLVIAVVISSERRLDRAPRRRVRRLISATTGRPGQAEVDHHARSSGSEIPTTLWWSPSIRVTNGPPSPSTVKAPATSSGSPVPDVRVDLGVAELGEPARWWTRPRTRSSCRRHAGTDQGVAGVQYAAAGRA